MSDKSLPTLASEAILVQKSAIAASLVEREFSRHPELSERYGAIGREKSLQDAGYHLSYLAQALALDSRTLFADYVAWAKAMLAQRGILASDLAFHFGCMADVLRDTLSGETGELGASFVEEAVAEMPEMPDDAPSFLSENAPLSLLAHQYFEALLRSERHLASRLVLKAVANGYPVRDIYLHVFQPAQYEIGRLWQTNRMTVAQEHYCTAATQLVMSQLYPYIFSTAKNGRTLVATCVAGDLHEIGVRMVADFFEMDGWSTHYLGANTPHASVVSTIVERRADVLAVSATITYHIQPLRELIKAVRADPEASRAKILAGGYPFNLEPDLWRKVGADGYAPNAQEAIAVANRLAREGMR